MIKRTLTAKTNLKLHNFNFRSDTLELHEWVAGNGYTAMFQPGEVVLQSEQGKVILNGVQQEEVRENFIFWGEEQA
jgi:hypothetical protein